MPKQIVHTLEVHVPPHVEAILPGGYGQVNVIKTYLIPYLTLPYLTLPYGHIKVLLFTMN